MKRRIFFVLFCLATLVLPSLAQKEVRQQLRRGNKSFKTEDYSAAEIDYRKAMEINPTDKQARYNLANTLYRTERGEEAVKNYVELLKEQVLLEPNEVADVAHNAGNLMMAAKQYQQAIEFYKESLRKRPTDDETRYNLALAQKLLEEQEGGGDNDPNQDQQEQDPQQDQQQDQNQNQDQDNQEEDNKQQSSPQPNEMSQENAEQILEAFLQNEKKTQEKIEKMKMEQQKSKSPRRKNW